MVAKPRKFPKPSASTIAAAVTGTSRKGMDTGLRLPVVQIDPFNNFYRGAIIYAYKIDRLSMSFKSFRDPLNESLRSVILPSINKNFDAQGRPHWKRLSKKTLYNRMIEGYPRGPILQKSGKLRKEVTKKNLWVVGADNVLSFRANFLDQKVPYASVHQGGARIPRNIVTHSLHTSLYTDQYKETSRMWSPGGDMGQIPARPYIKLTPDEEIEIYGIFVAFMVRKVEEYWMGGDDL